MKIQQGDIVLVPFPFTDLSSAKVRPAMVISKSYVQDTDLILCFISSKKRYSSAIELSRVDLMRGDIPVDSYIIPHKLATLDASLIKNVVACATSKFTSKVVSALIGVLI